MDKIDFVIWVLGWVAIYIYGTLEGERLRILSGEPKKEKKDTDTGGIIAFMIFVLIAVALWRE